MGVKPFQILYIVWIVLLGVDFTWVSNNDRQQIPCFAVGSFVLKYARTNFSKHMGHFRKHHSKIKNASTCSGIGFVLSHRLNTAPQYIHVFDFRFLSSPALTRLNRSLHTGQSSLLK